METFGLFHVYLIFFLLGLGYATIAIVMGQLLGGGEHVGGHELGGGHEIGGGHEVGDGHDVHVAGHGPAGHDVHGGHEAGHGAAGHGHGGAEATLAESMPSISPLSPVTVATFATSFGGIGLVLARVGLPGVVSLPLAGASGFAVAGAVFYVFFLVFRVTQSSSAVSPRQSLGKEAEVITAIPEKGAGEIAYVLGGRRFTAPARTEDGHPISRTASVVIVRITRGAYFVHESAAEP